MSDDPFAQFSLTSPKFPQAKCVNTAFDSDTWFPESLRICAERESQIDIAKAHCFSCVHQLDCLQFAVDNGISDGIWGGTLPEERAQAQKPATEVRQQKLDTIRESQKRGMSLQQACADAQICTKTFERYLHFEKAGWPSKISNQNKEKETK